MNIDDAIETLWQTTQSGHYPPPGLEKVLNFEDAYRIQFGILERRIAAGAHLAGWKVGLSSDATRHMFGLDAPVSAYLLASRRFESGRTFAYNSISKPIIESELCIIMGRTLKGPGITKEQALTAIGGAAPALELVDMRFNIGADLPLGVADGVAQWGFVTGPAVTPYPTDLNLGAMTVETKKNGELVASVQGKDAIDDQIQTVAWLANHLAQHDLALEAGQYIMTGSMTKPTLIEKGDTWQTTFSSIGTVSATFK